MPNIDDKEEKSEQNKKKFDTKEKSDPKENLVGKRHHEPDLDKKLSEEELKSALVNTQERLLAALAENQNMRRRHEAQVAEIKMYATTEIFKSLLPIMDGLSNALNNTEENVHLMKEIVQGVQMTKDELSKIFSRFGVEVIDPKPGDAFDCELHNAISKVKNENYPKNSIASLMQVGYKFKDRLLRAALVSVVE
ncbi:nucleotide exchange factor GrpE [Candidatus Sneabacter namystus]|uniref:Protein GrpE n=1 Tax=Candidatus Sneabacter namystus TaxID=2601646 RepID=A0A5C0UJB9_9RICK|nr:nucleotide exchange factor GrpE [Candidatus Sneabacter namystus]QEK39562.1 nucleotide exchange factor GrpE [Candidatus Sneabacter namystus]